jgi:signal transduction histidine kinase
MGDDGALSVSASADDGFVDVHISDTGCGIPEANRDSVFSPFFTTKEKGTGLGLAAALKAVEAHGGDIVLESEEGQGSTFTVRLPRAV